MTGRPVLVTLPASHPYVDAVVPGDVVHVGTRVPGAPAWAPDPLWDPQGWATLAARVDVVHVHFGFDHVDPSTLREWVRVTRAARVRLVLTVHDLRNPHHVDPVLLHRQLAVLVPAADVVMTLTEGAATALRRRFARDVVVVAHPAIYDGPAGVDPEPGLVGIHLKSFRASLGDVVPGVVAVAEGTAEAGGRLEISVHTDVVDDPRTAAVNAAVAGRSATSVVVRDRLDDDALRAYLTRLSVSVQLHRWGTHSGWVEACHDVGTTVVTPAVGFAAEQWSDVVTYPMDDATGPDLTALSAAVARALAAPAATPAHRSWRDDQLVAARSVHTRAYTA